MKQRTSFTTLLMLAVAPVVLSSVLLAEDYLPLEPGNQWVYRDASTGSTFTVRVGVPVQTNDQVYTTLNGYGAKQLWVRYNEYGNLVYWDQDLEQEHMLTAFEDARGAWFEADGRICPEMGQVQEGKSPYQGDAGRWPVLEIRYRTTACADAGDELEQFADNIGMVRRVVTTIAGPRTYDLVYARLGNQTITAGGTGSFSVTPTVSADSGWKATLRIDIPDSSSLTLHFRSSQEYDARLRDESGQIVWTWSANKLFAQVLHDLTVSGRWEAEIEVPYPLAAPELTRTYLLEVWMTTAPEDPQLAAVAPVTVEGNVGPARATSRPRLDRR